MTFFVYSSMFRYFIHFILLLNLLLSTHRTNPEYEIITNDNPYSSNILIHLMSEHMLVLDTNLQVSWDINSANNGMDFKKNSNVISYFDKTNEYWITANDQMQELDTLQCTSGITDYHDIRIIDNGSYIIQSYDSLYIDMSELVNGGHPNALIKGILRLEEFDNEHNLIFSWSAFDQLDISLYNNLNLTNQQLTWMHGNSIEIDYDSNILISNRRSSEIIKLNRETGEIIWIFGGPLNEFEIINDSFNGVRKQHDVRRLDNGNILIFDNGNEHSPPISRVVEYQIDEENKIAELVWEYPNPYNQVTLSMGSSQRLPNNNTLISWGNTQSFSVIMEVNYNKEIVLEIHYPAGYNTYKVRKKSWDFNIPMLFGDPNLDDTVNVLDILYLINYIFDYDEEKNIFNLYKIDINKDYNFDVTDVVGLVNIILY